MELYFIGRDKERKIHWARTGMKNEAGIKEHSEPS